jgi:hypothetical protein
LERTWKEAIVAGPARLLAETKKKAVVLRRFDRIRTKYKTEALSLAPTSSVTACSNISRYFQMIYYYFLA